MIRINPYYLLTVIVISCGGIPKGYDEGGFSASVGLTSFKNAYQLSAARWKNNPSGLAQRTANISSFGVLGAAFGALLALAVNDRFGRLKSWRFFALLWASGNLLQTFSSGIYGLMLFARLWGGLGAGGLTVITPLYLSEIAPAKTRGTIISIFQVFLLSFLSIGFFINYAASVRMAATPAQYRFVIAFPLIPVGLAFMGSFFLNDTPRWLASKGRGGEALAALARLRRTDSDAESISTEYEDICRRLNTAEESLEKVSSWTVIKEIACNPSYRERFLLGATIQTVAQWTGGNGITYYIPQIFVYAGIDGANNSLITSGAYGIVKFVFTMVFAWFLIDKIGRRRCMLIGLAIQCATHVYMSIYMALFMNSNNKSASDAAIASIFLYAVGWSVGLCTVQYIYATEIYPTRIRGVCYSVNMALHWFFQFAVVQVTPTMLVSFKIWGAYTFWAAICAIGLLFLGFWAPETKGVPMERMEELFQGRWFMGWAARINVGAESEDPSKGGRPVEAN